MSKQTTSEQTENPYPVPGLQRGLEILRLFRRDRPQLSAPEIARELDIPRTTVFRLLQTLEHMGFVVRTPNERDYRLGTAVLTLGFEFLASQEITELARPVLEQLRSSTGLSCHLVIRDGRWVVYLARFAGRSAFNSSISVGTRLPAHATALGRMLLADLSEQELNALYPDEQLEAHTPKTPKTLAQLKALLAEDRQRGYVISESFYEKGINAIAAPVRDASGRAVAVINLIARDGEVDAGDLHGRLLDQVLGAAAELSLNFDYQPRRQARALA
jgi:DNA-binding IclR family transcriptional regulator